MSAAPRSDMHGPKAPRAPVSRELAMKRWASTASTTDRMMGVVSRLKPVSSETREIYHNVVWDKHERMDFSVEWMLPASWQVAQRAKENLVSIQCAPPRPQRADAEIDPDALPTVHGMSLTAFAYRQKLKDPDSNALMTTFLRQFNVSVGNSLVTLGTSDPRQEGMDPSGEHTTRCKALQEQVGGTVTDIKFTPPQVSSVPARGLARTFFGTNLQTHYVAVFAVPEEEFACVEDLVIFAMTSVQEISRADAKS
jgi:hypothetical protein